MTPPLCAPPRQSPSPGHEPGLLSGVTHISRMTLYPEDISDSSIPRWVAHLNHPLELELVAQAEPGHNQWPTVYLQVGAMGGGGRLWQQQLGRLLVGG